VTWISTPHFYKSGRIIAIYVGTDNSFTSTLRGILGDPFAKG